MECNGKLCLSLFLAYYPQNYHELCKNIQKNYFQITYREVEGSVFSNGSHNLSTTQCPNLEDVRVI